MLGEAKPCRAQTRRGGLKWRRGTSSVMYHALCAPRRRRCLVPRYRRLLYRRRRYGEVVAEGVEVWYRHRRGQREAAVSPWRLVPPGSIELPLREVEVAEGVFGPVVAATARQR